MKARASTEPESEVTTAQIGSLLEPSFDGAGIGGFVGAGMGSFDGTLIGSDDGAGIGSLLEPVWEFDGAGIGGFVGVAAASVRVMVSVIEIVRNPLPRPFRVKSDPSVRL